MVKHQFTVYTSKQTEIRLNNLLKDSKGLFRNTSHLLEFVVEEGMKCVREKYLKK